MEVALGLLPQVLLGATAVMVAAAAVAVAEITRLVEVAAMAVC
jgi:hypothetical protein